MSPNQSFSHWCVPILLGTPMRKVINSGCMTGVFIQIPNFCILKHLFKTIRSPILCIKQIRKFIINLIVGKILSCYSYCIKVHYHQAE